MRLLTASFRNWCQFKSLDLEFKPGLTAIVGPNGAGKTNLLNGLFFAFTGDLRAAGIKEENINQLISSTEHAYVSLTFEHCGVTPTIKRSLRPNRNWMKIGDEEFRRSADIERELEEVLGVSKSIISDFVFVRQKGLDGLLHMTPGNRMIAFQQLFGLQHAERCYDAIAKYVKLLEVPPRPEEIPELERAIAADQKAISAMLGQLSDYDDIPDGWSPFTDPDYGLLESLRRNHAIKSRIKDLEQAVSELEHKKQTKADRVHWLNSQVDKASNELDGLDIVSIDSVIHAHHVATKVRTLRERNEKSLESVTQQLRALVEPIKPADLLTKSAFDKNRADRARLEKEAARLQHFVDAAHRTTSTVCIECGTPVEAMKEHAAEYQKRIDALSVELAALSATHMDYVAYHTAREVFDREQLHLTKLRESFSKQLEGLEKPDSVDESSLETASKQKVRYYELIQQIKTHERERNVLENDIKSLHYELQSVSDSLTASRAELAKAKPVKLDSLELKARLDHKDKRFREKIKLRSDLEAAKVGLSRLQAQCHAARTQAAEYRKYQIWLDRLERVRGVLGRGQLPKLLSENYLELMESDLNTTLDTLRCPFCVSVDKESLSFTAKFADGRVTKAPRLSEGEKAVLSLGLRIVVNSTFAGDIGLICLDEPTDGLDEDNLKCLEVALDRLRYFSQAVGLQCLLVTHERRLMTLFDHVIKL